MYGWIILSKLFLLNRVILNCLRLYNNIYKVFSVNKLFNFGKNSFIVYGSMYNLFDRNNEKKLFTIMTIQLKTILIIKTE